MQMEIFIEAFYLHHQISLFWLNSFYFYNKKSIAAGCLRIK